MLKKIFKFASSRSLPSQLELAMDRQVEPDRNFDRGGRSFYFFDFDDNLAFLTTPSVVFHKDTGEELWISSGEFAQNVELIGNQGRYKDYTISFDDEKGSFRYYRDFDMNLFHKVIGKKQRFVEDVAEALGFPDYHWKGPSWSCFYHATFNRRPLALITARGHHPDTIKKGLSLFVEQGHLPCQPNYLAIYPVNYPPVRLILGGEKTPSTADLKKAAIRNSVQQALDKYGHGPHRFGMSDDDPRNLQLIEEQMVELKILYPHMSFFVIEAFKHQLFKREIFAGGAGPRQTHELSQLKFPLENT